MSVPGKNFCPCHPLLVGCLGAILAAVGPLQSQDLRLDLPQGVPLGLVWIPPGRFRMGNDEGTLEERPEHRVTFSRGFFLGKFELTWGNFQCF